MEFSHLKNDMVYIKGTEEDKDDILILIRDFSDIFSTEFSHFYKRSEEHTSELQSH